MTKPESDPMPSPRRRSRLRRPTILLLMAVVAVVAGGLGVIHARMAAAERARVARLRHALIVAEVRMRRTLELRKRDAIPPSDVAKARVAMDRARAELKAFEGR
jgi:hypothetical protein